jgi:hypothetical protein
MQFVGPLQVLDARHRLHLIGCEQDKHLSARRHA